MTTETTLTREALAGYLAASGVTLEVFDALPQAAKASILAMCEALAAKDAQLAGAKRGRKPGQKDAKRAAFEAHEKAPEGSTLRRIQDAGGTRASELAAIWANSLPWAERFPAIERLFDGQPELLERALNPKPRAKRKQAEAPQTQASEAEQAEQPAAPATGAPEPQAQADEAADPAPKPNKGKGKKAK